MLRYAILLPLCVLVLCTGCAYRGYHTFSNSRKVWESDLNIVPKTMLTGFVMWPELAFAPIAINIDGANRDKKDEGFSFHGQRTLVEAPLDDSFKAIGGPLIVATDIALLPITGTFDVAKALMANDADDDLQAVSARSSQ